MPRTLITINLLATLAVIIGTDHLKPRLQSVNEPMPVACTPHDSRDSFHEGGVDVLPLACNDPECDHQIYDDDDQIEALV